MRQTAIIKRVEHTAEKLTQWARKESRIKPGARIHLSFTIEPQEVDWRLSEFFTLARCLDADVFSRTATRLAKGFIYAEDKGLFKKAKIETVHDFLWSEKSLSVMEAIPNFGLKCIAAVADVLIAEEITVPYYLEAYLRQYKGRLRR